MNWDKLFITHNITIDCKLEITVFEVKKISSEIIQCLDENLVSICEGENSLSDLASVKLRIKKLFNGKRETWQMGAIAEFFIHLYINLTGYRQECMFFNLEERSIKKGFDGYYSKANEQWVMESKSGSISTSRICHGIKINEAISDLKGKFSGKTSNDPWLNAYNHACHCDVGTPADIRRSIKKLSAEFANDTFHNLDEFNIMPCATIFLKNIWIPQNKDDIISEVETVIGRYQYKNAHLICVTQNSIQIFKDYIGI